MRRDAIVALPASVKTSLLAVAVLLLTPCVMVQARAQVATGPANLPSSKQVVDELGRSVKIPRSVRRIVSLAPSITETLFALGLGERVVGDTDFCDYPPEAKDRAHVGGPVNPNLETIASLHPDLVVVTRSINRLATVQSLEQLGIAVYATDPRTVEQVLESAQQLSNVLGAGEQGSRAVASWRARLEQLQTRLGGVQLTPALFVVWQTPLISVGRNTFLADALRTAGARSVIDSTQDWPNVSLERVVQLQPEVLIFANDEHDKSQRQIADLRAQPGWRDLEALRRGRIIVLGEAINHPSPRLLDSVEQLARALHPERFATSPSPGALYPKTSLNSMRWALAGVY